mgnify:CR=1 FL=1
MLVLVLVLVLELLNQLEHVRRVVERHAGGRLIEHVDVGLHRHQQRHLEFALIAVGQGGGEMGDQPEFRGLEGTFGPRGQPVRRLARPQNRLLWPDCACTARRVFSSALSAGNRLVSWKARPIP